MTSEPQRHELDLGFTKTIKETTIIVKIKIKEKKGKKKKEQKTQERKQRGYHKHTTHNKHTVEPRRCDG
jgi:hypothetical protein